MSFQRAHVMAQSARTFSNVFHGLLSAPIVRHCYSGAALCRPSSALLIPLDSISFQQKRSYPRPRHKWRYADMATKRAVKQELHWHRPEAINRNPLLTNMDEIRNPRKDGALETPEPDALYKTVDVECRSHDRAVLRSYLTFALAAAKHLEIPVSKSWQPKTIIWRQTVLRSVHIYKKHRVQYEARTNFQCFQLKHVTGSTLDTYLEYIQRNLPEGVGMKVIKTSSETIPPHIRQLIPAGTPILPVP